MRLRKNVPPDIRKGLSKKYQSLYSKHKIRQGRTGQNHNSNDTFSSTGSEV